MLIDLDDIDDGLREAAALEAQVATTRRGTGPAGRTS